MPDVLLLRFRDLSDESTIDVHEKIAKREGRVLWGWWRKPLEVFPDSGFMLLQRELKKGENCEAMLLDSASSCLYKADLLKIHYQPGGVEQPPPKEMKALCPKYYRKQPCFAWFELGRINEISAGQEELHSYVWSNNNSTSRGRSPYALRESDIGQCVADSDYLASHVSLWLITPTRDVGLAGRGSFISPFTRGIWPAAGRYAIHVSDLHYGDEHAFRNQLTTETGALVGKQRLVDAILSDLENVNDGIRMEDVSLLLVTGDLTWRADPHEFANASSALRELSRALSLHLSQIVVVPGNHDIEWRSGKDKKTIDKNAELNFTNFSRDLYNAPPDSLLARVHRLRIANRLVTIIGLNSCRIESEENAGLGFVGTKEFAKVGQFLKSVDREDNELRIALIHHHLIPVNYIEEIDWELRRVSILLDAESAIRNLMDFGVRLVLHGHQHQPFVAEERRIIPGFVGHLQRKNSLLDKVIAIVGGGSLGAGRKHLNLVGRNTYNLIDLGRDKGIEVRTRVQSSSGPGFEDYQRVVFDL